MKDLYSDYRDERRQGTARRTAMAAAIGFWMDDRSAAGALNGNAPERQLDESLVSGPRSHVLDPVAD
jgi:hypothetical protein